MRKIIIFVFAVGVLVGCSNSTSSEELDQKSAEITIYDAESWTVEDTNYSIIEDATVKLFSNEESLNSGNPEYEMQSDENGVSVFYDMEAGEYYMTVEKNELSNIINGYVLLGVFESQQEIDNSSHQSGATVGDYIFKDLNLDGVITDDDKAEADRITISSEEALIKEVYIGK